MKKITGTEFALLLLSSLFAIGFFGVGFEVYGLRRENKSLQQKVDNLDILLFSSTVHSTKEDFFLARQTQQNKEQLARLTNRTQVLEASLGADEVRWAKIKKVRDTIKGHERANLTISQMTDISAAVVDMSEQNDVPISLILAVIKQESAFDIRAVSSAGALGLMQIMPATSKDISIETNKRRYHLFNPRDNIQFGSYYLWKLLDQFDGDLELAVISYNAGPIFVQKVNSGQWTQKFSCKWKDGNISQEKYFCESADYGRKVLKYKQEFDRLGF